MACEYTDDRKMKFIFFPSSCRTSSAIVSCRCGLVPAIRARSEKYFACVEFACYVAYMSFFYDGYMVPVSPRERGLPTRGTWYPTDHLNGQILGFAS